jgi:ribosomal protein S18 acetylase RimI-like enzyme
VGFVAVGPSQDPDSDATTGEVTALGVHPAGRRQGHGSRLLNAGVDHLTTAGAEQLSIWILVDDEQTRVFLTGAGFAPDGAYRDRVVSADGEVLREVRLSCTLSA